MKLPDDTVLRTTVIKWHMTIIRAGKMKKKKQKAKKRLMFIPNLDLRNLVRYWATQ